VLPFCFQFPPQHQPGIHGQVPPGQQVPQYGGQVPHPNEIPQGQIYANQLPQGQIYPSGQVHPGQIPQGQVPPQVHPGQAPTQVKPGQASSQVSSQVQPGQAPPQHVQIPIQSQQGQNLNINPLPQHVAQPAEHLNEPLDVNKLNHGKDNADIGAVPQVQKAR